MIPKYSEVVPIELMDIIPNAYKKRKYVKVTVGDIRTIDAVTITSYKAVDKETKEPIEYRDGTPVYNHTVYLSFTDGTYTSVRNNLILAQMANVSDWDKSMTDDYTFSFDNPEKVRFVQEKPEKYKYPVFVLESVE